MNKVLVLNVRKKWPYQLSASLMSQLDSTCDQKYQGNPSFLLFVGLRYPREGYINSFRVL